MPLWIVGIETICHIVSVFERRAVPQQLAFP